MTVVVNILILIHMKIAQEIVWVILIMIMFVIKLKYSVVHIHGQLITILMQQMTMELVKQLRDVHMIGLLIMTLLQLKMIIHVTL